MALGAPGSLTPHRLIYPDFMPRAERSQRQLRPRQLSVTGSCMEHVAGHAPEVKARLLRGLNGFQAKARNLSGMRTLVIALLLNSAGALAQEPAPPPFEGVGNPFLGVTTSIDGYAVELELQALTYSLDLPSGGTIEWSTADQRGDQLPSLTLSCRVAGGYSAPKSLRATWEVPAQDIPEGTPKALRREAGRWGFPWPIQSSGSLDLAMRVAVGQSGLELTVRRGKDRKRVFVWHVDFWALESHASVARLMARHCKATGW